LAEKQQRQLITLLEEVRKHTSALLPIGHSYIPFDIMLTVVKGSNGGEYLTVKALFASLPYSDMGIRYHFNKLIDTGWIELHNGESDTRTKKVKPSQKLANRFMLLEDKLERIISRAK